MEQEVRRRGLLGKFFEKSFVLAPSGASQAAFSVANSFRRRRKETMLCDLRKLFPKTYRRSATPNGADMTSHKYAHLVMTKVIFVYRKRRKRGEGRYGKADEVLKVAARVFKVL